MTAMNAEQLAAFLDKQAAELRADSANSPFNYGRGNDRGMAQGFEIAAKLIRQDLVGP